MAEPTILIRYGLVYVSWTTDRELSGSTVYLVACDGNCNLLGDEGSLDTLGMNVAYGSFVRLGTINSNGRLVSDTGSNTTYAYVVETTNYIQKKNFYVIAVEEVPDEGKYVVKAHGPSGNPVTTVLDTVDYGITLDQDNDGFLVTDDGDGLEIAIVRPILSEEDETAGKNIFDDTSQFTYKLNLYRVPWDYDPVSAIKQYDHNREYSNGDMVTVDSDIYICVMPGSVRGLTPGTAPAAGTWKQYEVDCPKIYQPADGQTLIRTITLSEGSNEIVSADTETSFSPNTKYKYALTIFAEQRNGAEKLVSEEFLCAVVGGNTPSCLKFDTTVTPGELCVVDYEDNITSAQNVAATSGFSGIAFPKMGGSPQYLHVVAFSGNNNAQSSFETWAEQNCKNFVKIAEANIPEEIETYNPSISGTIKMSLELPETQDISVSATAKSVTYDKTPHEPSEFLTLTGTEEEDQITVEFVDDQGNVLAEQTVTNATTGLWVKVTIDRGEGYNVFTRTVEVTLSQATVTITGSTAADKDYDGTDTAEITLGTVGGVVDGDDVEVTAAGTFENTEPGENKTVTIVFALGGSDAANYRIENGTTTATINRLTIDGVTFTGGTITYDGNNHGYTLLGANTTTDTIAYSTDGVTYNLSTCPVYKEVGTYTVYVKVSRAHYNDLTTSADLEIAAKEITIDNVEVGSVAYGETASTNVTNYSVSSEGVAITGNEKSTLDTLITWSASFDNTSALGTHDVEVTATLTSTNYVFSNGTDTVTTTVSGNVYTKYELSSNGRASSGDGSVADGRGAEETTELYIDFDADPGDIDQSNIIITAGGAYVAKTGAGTLTPVLEGTKYRITIPVKKTSTESTGIDNVQVTIENVAKVDSKQSNATETYLPMLYWGNYPFTEQEDDNLQAKPTVAMIKAFDGGYRLTGAKESPKTVRFEDTSDAYCTVAYYMSAWGKVPNPSSGGLEDVFATLTDPDNIYSGKHSQCGDYKGTGAGSYEFTITEE